MGAYYSSGAKGWLLALVAALVLLASYLLPMDSMLQTFSVALRPVAWLALLVGLAFAIYLRVTRGHKRVEREPAATEDEAQAGMTRPSVLAALGVGRASMAATSELAPRFVDTIAVHPVPDDAADEEAQADEALSDSGWSPRVLERIDWRNFEALCTAFFKQAGFSTSTQGQPAEGGNGGVDIWVQSRHMPEPRIVRCRHWEGQQVTAKELRDFLAAISTQGLAHGTYVTSSTFTPEAMDFAKANGIQTQDGEALLKLISHRTQEQQQALLDVAAISAVAKHAQGETAGAS
jgi:restriction system protein